MNFVLIAERVGCRSPEVPAFSTCGKYTLAMSEDIGSFSGSQIG
jgi:hypothetical protein